MKQVVIMVAILTFVSVVNFSPVIALDGNAEAGFNSGINQVGGDSGRNDLLSLINNVINALLFVVGIAAVIIMVVSGLRFVTSEGDAQAANKARNTVIYAAIGLVVSVLSYAIINFILDQLK